MCISTSDGFRVVSISNMSAQSAADDQAELSIVDVIQKEVCVEIMRWMKRIVKKSLNMMYNEGIMIEIR